MNYVETIVLGVVQGVAEFLPISSSGHLVVVDAVWQYATGATHEDLLETNIVLHGGTLLSILVVYWHRIWRLLADDRRVIGKIVVGTVPAILVGLPLKKYGEWMLESPLLAGLMLPVTGAILLWGARRRVGETLYADISYRQALLIGLAQAVAILPGISRSGSTIVAGIAVGLRRDAAAAFSFMLAIPAIGGAMTLEVLKLAKQWLDASHTATELASSADASGSLAAAAVDAKLGPLFVGAVVAFVVGVAALRLLLSWLEAGRLHWFAYWCIAVGLGVIAWQAAVLTGLAPALGT